MPGLPAGLVLLPFVRAGLSPSLSIIRGADDVARGIKGAVLGRGLTLPVVGTLPVVLSSCAFAEAANANTIAVTIAAQISDDKGTAFCNFCMEDKEIDFMMIRAKNQRSWSQINYKTSGPHGQPLYTQRKKARNRGLRY